MSSEERSPEHSKEIKGEKNKAIQGDYNQVFEGGIKIVFAFINWFSPTTSSSPSSGHKPPKLNGRKLKLWIKKLKWLIVVIIAVLTVAGVYGIFKSKNASLKISLGEEILIKSDIPIEKKQELEKAFSNKDYQQFRYLLGDYLRQNSNSPELWVYWNNVKAALLSVKNPIKIAVSIPIGTNFDVAKEILRGVALAQNEINARNNETGINGQLLQVVIANDNNEDGLAKQVAQRFVQDPSILAVVGHNASNATKKAKAIYTGKLVMITPTSFSDAIQGDPYIFRMVPQISYFANKLARYIEQKNPNSTVGTCIDPKTADNDSLIAQFEAVFSNKTFQLSCDFLDPESKSSSSIANVLREIKQQKINSVILAPYINRITEIIQISQDIHSQNSSIRLYGSPTFFTQETLEAGQASEGLTLSVPWYPSEKNVQYQKDFKQLYLETETTERDNWRTAMAYDATRIIIKGLEQISQKQQQIGRKQLNNVLTGEGNSKFIYDGATGKTIFSDSGVNEIQSDVIVQIQNGQFKKISSE
jgi:branched-chain amino acid transport system substrate-binding protein